MEPAPGRRLLAGRDDDVWVVEIVDVREDLIHFKLIERGRIDIPSRRAAG
ncbi:MAG: hypothetical protein KY462_13110 [Actinobacteria bacterium]|nr:hypothetical protein [Actinomycetota bacterium]